METTSWYGVATGTGVFQLAPCHLGYKLEAALKTIDAVNKLLDVAIRVLNSTECECK